MVFLLAPSSTTGKIAVLSSLESNCLSEGSLEDIDPEGRWMSSVPAVSYFVLRDFQEQNPQAWDGPY
jgi:hypothetical protein